MSSWSPLLVIGACLVAALLGLVGYTLHARRRAERREAGDRQVWRRAYHLAAELAAGRGLDRHGAAFCEMVDAAADPMLVAVAASVAVRQQPDQVDPALYQVVNRSSLASRLRGALRTESANDRIEVLEIVEVLRIQELFGDAAVMTRDEHPGVVRAACDAVVALEPAAGLAMLIGLAGKHDSWVIDSMGRAAARLTASGRGTIPLSREKWRSAPLLAQRAISESATFDTATVADAVSALIGALESPSSTVRLAAITALAGTVENHPAAQLALAGALGSPDRMIRFATAAALSDTVAGQAILRAAAADGDGTDAARIAAEILWTHDPFIPPAAVAS